MRISFKFKHWKQGQRQGAAPATQGGTGHGKG